MNEYINWSSLTVTLNAPVCLCVCVCVMSGTDIWAENDLGSNII
jgi:hypothetical protein